MHCDDESRTESRAACCAPDRSSPEPQRVRGKVMQQARVTRPCSRGCCGSGEPRSGGGLEKFGPQRFASVILTLLLLLTTNLSAAIRLDMFVGYDGILTQGGFFPVVFEVFNDGPGFKGLLELTPGQFGQGQVRQVPVELPTGTLKRIVIPVFSAQQYGSSSWNVRLLDDRRRLRAETTSRPIRKNNPFGIPLLAAVTRTPPPLPEVKASGQDMKPMVARLQPICFLTIQSPSKVSTPSILIPKKPSRWARRNWPRSSPGFAAAVI